MKYERANKNKNYNCDGAHCGDKDGEVRVYPLGAGGNLILCISCAAHENHYRYLRGKETGQPANFPQVNWFECEVYKEAAS
jgi:hypothetical protein